MARDEVKGLVRRLYDAQQMVSDCVLANCSYETLPQELAGTWNSARPGNPPFTVNDVLRMWVWHFTSHYRDLIRARGSLEGDNPHFHVPHFVRQAHEELGRFVGELECMTDEQLDLRPANGGFSIREAAEHVAATLEGYFPSQIERAKPEQG